MSEQDELFPITGARMPALFVGHGSPMNAIEDNAFTRAWRDVAASQPRPKAILCISAHWETVGTRVATSARPKTIYDFYGFPEQLYERTYPAPGSPGLARAVQICLAGHPILPDAEWGLDHGAWCILSRMYPEAGIPVVQLSLDRRLPPEAHYALAWHLSGLRERGILLLGSGNLVHNLPQMTDDGAAHEWAVAFDEQVARAVASGDHDKVIHYEALGRAAQLSVPTNEHYLPLLYILGVQSADDPVAFFAEGIALGSISMRSVRVG